ESGAPVACGCLCHYSWTKMRNRYFTVCFGLATIATSLAGQSWKVPRTPDGQPDLQGIWTNAVLTPLQRPADLGDKQFFTEQEAAAYEKLRIQQTNSDLV